MTSTSLNIFVVEEEVATKRLITTAIHNSGVHTLDYFNTGGDLLASLNVCPDVVFLSNRIADRSTTTVVSTLKSVAPHCKVIVLFNSRNPETWYHLQRAGATAYLIRADVRKEQIEQILLEAADAQLGFGGWVRKWKRLYRESRRAAAFTLS